MCLLWILGCSVTARYLLCWQKHFFFFFSIYTNIFPTSLPLGIASNYKNSFPHLFFGLLSLKTASLSGGRTNEPH